MYKYFLFSFLLFSSLYAKPLEMLDSYDQAIQSAIKQNKRVLLFIYADHCSWCKKMKATTLSNQKVIDFINKDFIFVKMNRNSSEYPKEFTPRFIPTTYLIEPQTGEEVYALYGYKTVSQFLYELEGE